MRKIYEHEVLLCLLTANLSNMGVYGSCLIKLKCCNTSLIVFFLPFQHLKLSQSAYFFFHCFQEDYVQSGEILFIIMHCKVPMKLLELTALKDFLFCYTSWE